NDDPGRKHVRNVASSVHGKAASVKVLDLPGLPEHGDVSDWLDAHTIDELLERVEATPEWQPAGKAKRKSSHPTITADSLDLRSAAARTDLANARRFASMHGDSVRWCEPWGKW